MPYRFKTSESLQHGVRRIVCEQVDRALAELADTRLDRAGTIHQVRKRCKKIRGVLRLVRSGLDAYARENGRYRDAARVLSDLRDADALIDTCDALSTQSAGEMDAAKMQAIRAELATQRDAAMSDINRIDEYLRGFEAAIVAGRKSATTLAVDDNAYGVALEGLFKTYARARDAMDAAFEKPTREAFHEWRKRVKYHGFHVRLLGDVWPAMMKARRDELDTLGELLGDHHNLSVLQARLLEYPALHADDANLDDFIVCVDRRTAELEDQSRPLGRRLFAEKPKHLERRFAAYLEIWRERG